MPKYRLLGDFVRDGNLVIGYSELGADGNVLKGVLPKQFVLLGDGAYSPAVAPDVTFSPGDRPEEVFRRIVARDAAASGGAGVARAERVAANIEYLYDERRPTSPAPGVITHMIARKPGRGQTDCISF